jgi:16S rRNA (guanine(1405)-N(7))-methyltransferase
VSQGEGREPSAEAVAHAVAQSRRYHSVDPGLLRRLADEELPRARNAEDAVKRVKRRLHQAVGAYRPSRPARAERDLELLAAAHDHDPSGAALRAACRDLLSRHASTRERLPYLDRFYAGIWDAVGRPPVSILDLGCGLAPLALSWMGLPASTLYTAIDVDAGAITLVDGFLTLVDQPHTAEVRDLASPLTSAPADVALLLKLVPILDRQHPDAAIRLIRSLSADHIVLSFPVRSLGGLRRGMEATYRRRADALMAGLGSRVSEVREASVPNELVLVMNLGPVDAAISA